MISKLNIQLFLLGFFALIPIFLSYGDGFALDRRAYYDNSKYFVSIPVSLFLVFFIIRDNILKGLYNLLFSKIFIISFLILIMHFFSRFQFDYLLYKNIFSIILFYLTIKSSSSYFSNKTYHLSLDEKIKKYNNLCVYPSFVQLLIILISFMIYSYPFYIHSDFVIFNFEQYLAVSFIAAAFVQKNKLMTGIMWLLIYLISLKTSNITNLIILLFFVSLTFFPFRIFKIETQLFIIKFIIYTLIIMGLTYSFWGIDKIIFELFEQRGFMSRVEVVNEFILNLQFQNIFFPFLGDKQIYIYDEYHNQYLNIYHSFGIFTIYFLFKTINFTIQIYKIRQFFAFIIIGILFLGSFSLNTILHPYLIIFYGVLIGFWDNIIASHKNQKFKKS